MAKTLKVTWDLVTPYVKNPNRSERAIRTAKNHLISAWAGFHPEGPHTYLDKCLYQIEMTLNILRPFEYDPGISAYEGLHGCTFNFQQQQLDCVRPDIATSHHQSRPTQLRRRSPPQLVSLPLSNTSHTITHSQRHQRSFLSDSKGCPFGTKSETKVCPNGSKSKIKGCPSGTKAEIKGCPIGTTKTIGLRRVM
jgi:hypothetical protein